MLKKRTATAEKAENINSMKIMKAQAIFIPHLKFHS